MDASSVTWSLVDIGWTPPKEEIFSGVVSMEAVHLGFLLARLNGLMVVLVMLASNAFFYGKTCEKVQVIAGEKFRVHKGKCMIYRSVILWTSI